jgi:1-acyl-sn-glycerol-3-phosphate acyltransferase
VAIAAIRAGLRHFAERLTIHVSLLLLGLICLSWTLIALPLWWLLPAGPGRRCGRYGIFVGIRFFVWTLRAMGIYRLDVQALYALRDGPPVVIAPNHPSMIDALIIVAYVPNVGCIMKSALEHNVFLGVGARLARYIGNVPTRQMIAGAVAELRGGNSLLLFPEGTRTVHAPINPLTASVAIIARHANAPVQTLIIEQCTPFLGKGWSVLRWQSLPVVYRMRLGRRFEPQPDARALTTDLERYFREELASSVQNRWIGSPRTGAPTH